MSAAQAAGTRSREGDVGLRINHHSMKIRLNFRRETRERINRENGSNGFVSNFFFFLFFFFSFPFRKSKKIASVHLSLVLLSSKFFVLSYLLINLYAFRNS